MAVPAVTSLLQARTGRLFSVALQLAPRRLCCVPKLKRKNQAGVEGSGSGYGAQRGDPCRRHRCCLRSPRPCSRLGRRLGSCYQAPPAVMWRCDRGAAVAQGRRLRSATGSAVPGGIMPTPSPTSRADCLPLGAPGAPGRPFVWCAAAERCAGSCRALEPRHPERRRSEPPQPIGGRRPQASLARRCPVP